MRDTTFKENLQMSMRHFNAALLVASALLLAPQIVRAQRNSSSSRSTYTPPPPRPAPVYTPRPANSNVRSPGQTPQASNNNSVRPTPRTTVTPRNPQPRATTPNFSNPRIQQQIANQNNRNRQI